MSFNFFDTGLSPDLKTEVISKYELSARRRTMHGISDFMNLDLNNDLNNDLTFPTVNENMHEMESIEFFDDDLITAEIILNQNISNEDVNQLLTDEEQSLALAMRTMEEEETHNDLAGNEEPIETYAGQQQTDTDVFFLENDAISNSRFGFFNQFSGANDAEIEIEYPLSALHRYE